MPRSNGVYSEPAGTKGTPNTTIQSAPYNSFVDDLVADMNGARPITAGGTGATSASGARSALGVAIGTNVQAYDAGLQSIAGLTTAADRMIYTTAADVYAVAPLTPFARTILDDANAAAMRATLGLGSLAVLNSVNNLNWSGGDLSISNGGTGASTAADARENLGLVAIATSGSASDLTTGYIPPERIKHWIASASDNGLVYISNSPDGTVGGKVGLTTAGTFLYSYNDVEMFRVGANGVMGTVSIPAGLITGLTVNDGNWSGADLSIANGGTGASTPAAARTNLGLAAIAATGSAADLTSGFIANARLQHFLASDNADGLAYIVNTGDGTTGGKAGLSTAGTFVYSYNNVERFRVNTDGSLGTVSISAGLVDNGVFDIARIPVVSVAKGGTGATTAGGARTALGLGQLATLDRADLVYTGSTSNNLDFPVGSYLWVYVPTTTPNRNGSAAIYLRSGDPAKYSTEASGTALTGTWRSRGAADGNSFGLFQRTA